MKLQIFADELLIHRRYLRARLHLRPIIKLETAEIIHINGVIKLNYCIKDNWILLFTDSIISGIEDFDEWSVSLLYHANGKLLKKEIRNIVQHDMACHDKLSALNRKMWNNIQNKLPKWNVLEIGSRIRQATKSYLNLKGSAKSYIGMDIRSGPNVDVVGDAHKLSSYFKGEYFDFVYSQWVWEHLAMPWVAVSELNKILKKNGTAFILSNHTIGLHDLPWDFFRFSESAWISLFNINTGFEIINTALGEGVRIIPMRYTNGHKDHEGGLGYFGSAVWVRKTENINLTWDVNTKTIYDKLERFYPKEITD